MTGARLRRGPFSEIFVLLQHILREKPFFTAAEKAVCVVLRVLPVGIAPVAL